MVFEIESFFLEHKFVILFYATIIFLVYLNRKKFDIQAKFIALYKTKFGLKIINKIGKKYKELIKILGYVGIGIGFIGMVYISYVLIKNLYDLVTTPGMQSAVTLVLPGVKVPGSPIFIPLISGWIALFLVILVHEFSHGIVAIANKIKVKSSGIFFIGPFMGAFVEPDEKQLRTKPDAIQYSVFAAGPFSNMILALLIAFTLLFLINPTLEKMTEPIGFSINEVKPGTPAEIEGLKPSMIFNKLNGEPITGYEPFMEIMNKTKPNQIITLSTKQQTFTITTTQHPENQEKGYLGIAGIKNEFSLKQNFQNMKPIYNILLLLTELFGLVFLLSLGIGIANLLPLGIADGGRMLQISLQNTIGTKKGNKLWKDISILCLIVLIMNVVLGIALPILK